MELLKVVGILLLISAAANWIIFPLFDRMSANRVKAKKERELQKLMRQSEKNSQRDRAKNELYQAKLHAEEDKAQKQWRSVYENAKHSSLASSLLSKHRPMIDEMAEGIFRIFQKACNDSTAESCHWECVVGNNQISGGHSRAFQNITIVFAERNLPNLDSVDLKWALLALVGSAVEEMIAQKGPLCRQTEVKFFASGDQSVVRVTMTYALDRKLDSWV